MIQPDTLGIIIAHETGYPVDQTQTVFGRLITELMTDDDFTDQT